MKARLCLEAAERLQWPRLYLLSRPRSRGCLPSLVSDCDQVLQVLGWALTRIRTLLLGYTLPAKGAERWLCMEQSHELFSYIRGGGGASDACFHSWMSPSHRQAVNFSKWAFILVQSKLSIPRVVTNMPTLRVALNKRWHK